MLLSNNEPTLLPAKDLMDIGANVGNKYDIYSGVGVADIPKLMKALNGQRLSKHHDSEPTSSINSWHTANAFTVYTPHHYNPWLEQYPIAKAIGHHILHTSYTNDDDPNTQYVFTTSEHKTINYEAHCFALGLLFAHVDKTPTKYNNSVDAISSHYKLEPKHFTHYNKLLY